MIHRLDISIALSTNNKIMKLVALSSSLCSYASHFKSVDNSFFEFCAHNRSILIGNRRKEKFLFSIKTFQTL